MSTVIINNCKKTYNPDPEKIVQEILQRIPNKFLAGLSEVRILDTRKRQEPSVRYILNSDKFKSPIIEIYMDDPTFSGRPFFPIFCLNEAFISAINEHIERYLKFQTNERDILLLDTKKINYDWMYVGIWSPVLKIFRMLHYLMARSRTLNRIILYSMSQFIKNLEKRK